MKKIIFFFLLILFFNECATLRKNQRNKVISPDHSKVKDCDCPKW